MTKFGGNLGNDLRYRNAKGCNIGSKGLQWGWGQSFRDTPFVDHFQQNSVIFLHSIAPKYAEDNFSLRWGSRFSHSSLVREIRPPKDPLFPDFLPFCQSLVQDDVTAVTIAQVCYTSLERTQKIEQKGTNIIFNFASLGKTQPPKVSTLKKVILFQVQGITVLDAQSATLRNLCSLCPT